MSAAVESAPAVSASPSLTISIRPLSVDDHGYARATWREGMKDAPAYERMPWSLYKQTAGATVAKLVADAQMLGAYVADGRILGWLCMSPGRAVNTLHWVHTRYDLDGDRCRRRGVMSALVDAAQLGRRIAYTFHGPRRRGSSHGPEGSRASGRGASLDTVLVEWLRQRGTIATHIPYSEWSK